MLHPSWGQNLWAAQCTKMVCLQKNIPEYINFGEKCIIWVTLDKKMSFSGVFFPLENVLTFFTLTNEEI